MWFPLVIFGLVILASTPLYMHFNGDTPPLPALLAPDVLAPTAPPATDIAIGGSSGLLHFFTGGMFAFSPLKITVFWLVAGPMAYLVTAGFYWLRAGRRWVATSTPLIPIPVPGDLMVRGLTPLLAVALGLFVLARIERSWALLAFAVPFLALTVVANLYDMENVAYRLGVGSAGPEVNVIVVGSVLLIAGAIFGLGYARTRQRAS